MSKTKDYLKIADYIVKLITDGELKEDDKIPSVNKLTDLLGVNRNSTVKGLTRLESQGVIVAVHGKGYYVNKKRNLVPGFVARNSRFTQPFNTKEKREARLLDVDLTEPTSLERETLNLQKDELVYRLEILRIIQKIPISVVTTTLPEKFVPKLEQKIENFTSLYAILDKYYGFIPIRKISYIEARMPSCEEAELLEMPENIPILWKKSINTKTSREPVMMDITRIRADRSQVIIDLENIESNMTVNLNPEN